MLPYHQARYAPNHAILSVTDKLHKIYSLSSGPAVWARSVGVEVLNELGPLKGAMMGAAGATVSKATGGADSGSLPLWNAAASGLEALNSTTQVGKALLGAMGSTVGTVAQNIVRNISAR